MNELQDLGVTLNSQSAWSSPFAYSATTLAGSLNLNVYTAGWVFEATRKLEALRRLRAGWDSYAGLPLKPEARNFTVRILGWLGREELPVPAVVLGSGGTIQLEWRAKGKELDVELRDNDTIEYVKASPGGEIEEGEAGPNLPAKLQHLAGWLLRD